MFLQAGQQRLFELGKYLRRRYAKLLNGRDYTFDMMYIRSTYIRRTMLSATAAMSGFYNYAKWNDSIEPVEVFAVPLEKDNILWFINCECPKYDYEVNRLQKETNSATLKKYKSLVEHLEKHTNQSIRSISKIYDIHDRLTVLQSLNLT